MHDLELHGLRSKLHRRGCPGSILVLVGVLIMRWNVVIGGQLFSKSLMGLTTNRLELIGNEGILVAAGIFLLPFAILFLLVKLLPHWPDSAPGGPQPV